MGLRLGRARADRGPGNEIAQILRRDGIERFRSDAESEIGEAETFTQDLTDDADNLAWTQSRRMMAMADMAYPGVGVSLIYHLNEDPHKGFDPVEFMKKQF